jgi:hypothetical protein
VPVEGGEKKRRSSGVQSRAEEVARGARRCAARWRWPGQRRLRRPRWETSRGAVTPHVSNAHDYVNHMFKRP